MGKVFLTVFFFGTLSLSVFGQRNSDIYNSNLQLRVDTSISISENNYEVWNTVKRQIFFQVLSNYSTPEILVDNNISLTCLFSFRFDSINGFYDISMQFIGYKPRSPDGIRDKFLIPEFKRVLENDSFLRSLMERVSFDSSMVFWLPLNLTVLSRWEYIDSTGFLEVVTPSKPLIDKVNSTY